MPPNSTQNLNAKLSPPGSGPGPRPGSGVHLGAPPIQCYTPPVRIVGGRRYRGGYHLGALAA